jgi:hypothetical protein
MAVIIGTRDPQRGTDAATTLRGEGIDAHPVRLDVTDEHTIPSHMTKRTKASAMDGFGAPFRIAMPSGLITVKLSGMTKPILSAPASLTCAQA